MPAAMPASWTALYADWTRWFSGQQPWEDLPSVGMIRADIFHPTPDYRTVLSGWDVYALLAEEWGLRAIRWKEDDPKDPFYGKGAEARFYDDGHQEASGYGPAEAWSWIPPEARKRGVWVEDATARAMGVL